jgi:hypothetical protein
MFAEIRRKFRQGKKIVNISGAPLHMSWTVRLINKYVVTLCTKCSVIFGDFPAGWVKICEFARNCKNFPKNYSENIKYLNLYENNQIRIANIPTRILRDICEDKKEHFRPHSRPPSDNAAHHALTHRRGNQRCFPPH